MKTLVKFLAMLLFVTAFVACSDDDDNPPVIINDIMVVHNSNTGIFSAINLNDGSLTSLGSFSYNGEVLEGLRDIVYNPDNNTIYASSRSNSNNGAVFSIDPTTLEATMLNDNLDDDWYAIPGLELFNNQLIGTVYWDDYDNSQANEGLIWLNQDGSFNNFEPLLWQGNDLDLYEGMGIEYTSNGTELLITRYDEVIVSNLNGEVMEIIELDEVNFPDDEYLDGIRTLETSEDGVIYGIDRYNHFGRIDLTVGSPVGTFTYITTLTPEDDKYVALSLIPENIFDQIPQ
jgi:hypothetical protein